MYRKQKSEEKMTTNLKFRTYDQFRQYTSSYMGGPEVY